MSAVTNTETTEYSETNRRRPTKRTTAPAWTERDQAWMSEAKGWMTENVTRFFEGTSSGPSYYTTSDVLGWLDCRPEIPTAYVRFLGDYPQRYNWLNSLLERQARKGALETSVTTNARGREARCYRQARSSEFSVEAEGPGADQAVAAIKAWLEANPGMELDSLLITRSHKATKTYPVDWEKFSTKATGSSPPDTENAPVGQPSAFAVESLKKRGK